MTITMQKSVPDKEARALLKVQIAEHLAGHPNTQRTHIWMKRVEAVGLGIVIAVFAFALFGSFAWSDANTQMIPVVWFVFATVLSLMTAISGLHAILIRAYPPIVLPGKPQKFVSGSTGIWTGAFYI